MVLLPMCDIASQLCRRSRSTPDSDHDDDTNSGDSRADSEDAGNPEAGHQRPKHHRREKLAGVAN